jgi:hypothetical protein
MESKNPILFIFPSSQGADHSGRAVQGMNSNTVITGSNPIQGMDVYLRLFCVCVGSGLATG